MFLWIQIYRCLRQNAPWKRRTRGKTSPKSSEPAGVHKGGLSKGGFSNNNNNDKKKKKIITHKLLNPPLLNPPLQTPETGGRRAALMQPADYHHCHRDQKFP